MKLIHSSRYHNCLAKIIAGIKWEEGRKNKELIILLLLLEKEAICTDHI